MDKAEAIRLLGGTNTSAAEAIGVTPAAVSQWPEVLPDRIVDRVQAALVRKQAPAVLRGLMLASRPTQPEKAEG